MATRVLLAQLLDFVLVEADGRVGSAVVDVAVRRILAETARKATHYSKLLL